MTMLLAGTRSESDERHELRAQVRRLLGRHWSDQNVLQFADGDLDAGHELMEMLDREMGLNALRIPEQAGGLGGGWVETAIAAEELGAAMAPSRLLGDVMAVTFLAGIGGPSCNALLEKIAARETTVSLVWPGVDATWDIRQIDVARWDGARLTGTFRWVPDVESADVLLVPASDGSSLGVTIVSTGDESSGLDITPVQSPDRFRPVANLSVSGADGSFEPLANPNPVYAGAVASGALLLAAEMIGAARTCLERTSTYTQQRKQFGRPIATFQAVKHRLVDILVAWEPARAMTYRAADRLDKSDGSDMVECLSLVRMAKAAATDALQLASRQSVQLHGGIGFTWENGSHFFLRKCMASSTLYGQPEDLRIQVYRELVGPIR